MADRLRREDGGEDCVDDAWREAAGSLLFGVLEPEPMELLRKFINVAPPIKERVSKIRGEVMTISIRP